jgi:hypothetical protein
LELVGGLSQTAALADARMMCEALSTVGFVMPLWSG